MKLTLTHSLIFLGIGLSILTAAWLPLHHDLYFHTDIARDFLLIQEVIATHKPTLIGPRTSIPGLFHGPLWLYLNLPIYYFSQGNPVVTGFYWVVLFIISLGGFFLLLRRLFPMEATIMGTLLYGAILAPSVANSFNPIGAVYLSPWWFYLVLKYFKQRHVITLAGSFFILGLVAQFEIAYAVPMLVLEIGFLIPYTWKHHCRRHLLSVFCMMPPFTTQLLFEYRHQFLQTQAILTYLKGSPREESYNLFKTLGQRTTAMLIDGLGILPKPFSFILPLCLGLALLFKKIKVTLSKHLVLWLFLYFYLGFWLLSIGFRGAVWGFYYWPFMPLAVMAIMSLYPAQKKVTYRIFVGIIILLNVSRLVTFMVNSRQFTGIDPGSWKFQADVASAVVQDTPTDFGYFVYTPDQYGYPPRYALAYFTQTLKQKIAYSYEKKPMTVLVIAPDSPSNPYTSSGYWKTTKLKISTAPGKVTTYPNGYRVEYYSLSEKEINTGTDETLIKDMYFR